MVAVVVPVAIAIVQRCLQTLLSNAVITHCCHCETPSLPCHHLAVVHSCNLKMLSNAAALLPLNIVSIVQCHHCHHHHWTHHCPLPKKEAAPPPPPSVPTTTPRWKYLQVQTTWTYFNLSRVAVILRINFSVRSVDLSFWNYFGLNTPNKQALSHDYGKKLFIFVTPNIHGNMSN